MKPFNILCGLTFLAIAACSSDNGDGDTVAGVTNNRVSDSGVDVRTNTNDAGANNGSGDEIACTEFTDCVEVLAGQPFFFSNPDAAFCEKPGTKDSRCAECDSSGNSLDCPVGHSCRRHGGCLPFECIEGGCGGKGSEWTCDPDDGRCKHPDQPML